MRFLHSVAFCALTLLAVTVMAVPLQRRLVHRVPRQTDDVAMARMDLSMSASVPEFVKVDGRTIARSGAHSPYVYHTRSRIGQAIPVEFKFTNHQTTVVSWKTHAQDDGHYAIIFRVGGGGNIGALVHDVLTHNFAIVDGANEFDVKLVHNAETTVLQLKIVGEAYTHDVSAGVEYEIPLELRLVDVQNSANQAQLSKSGLRATHTEAVTLGRPKLAVELDGVKDDGVTNRRAIIELTTAPFKIGTAHNDVPQDWRDLSHAMSQFMASATAVLGNACTDQNSVTHVAPGGGANEKYRRFGAVVTHYNEAIEATAAHNHNARASLRDFKLKAVESVTQDDHTYVWMAWCSFPYAANRVSAQINIDYPLTRMAVIKPAADAHGAIDNANPTHYIDFFPPYNHANQRIIQKYHGQALMWKRAQSAAHGVVDGLALYPVHDDITLLELKGAVTLVLYEVMMQLHVQCFQQHQDTTADDKPGGWSKTHHVINIKTCANDVLRYFPNALTDPLRNWWSNGQVIANFVDNTLMAVASDATGQFPPPMCSTATNHGIRDSVHDDQHYLAKYVKRRATRMTRMAFHSFAVWSERYGQTETNQHLGTAGVTNRAKTEMGNVDADPPTDWTCLSDTNKDDTVLPLGGARRVLQGRLGVVAETRLTPANDPLNAGMVVTADPTQNDGNSQLQATLNKLRRLTGAPTGY